jgi:O-antigen ligase
MSTLARVPDFWQELAEFYRLEPKRFILGLLAILLIFGLGISYLLVNLGPLYAFFGLLAIPFGILISSRPAIGLVLVVIFIPLENFNQFNFGGISTFEVVFMLSLGFAVLNYLIFRKGESLVQDSQSWLIFALLAVVLISNFVAFDGPRTLERTFRLVRNMALYFFAIFVIRTRRELQWLIWAFILSGAVSAVYGLYVYYFNPSALLESSDKVARVIGTMEDPNEFAGAMLIRLMLALSLLSIEMKRYSKLLLIGVVLVLLSSIFLTGSRGGLLGTGLAFLAYAIFSRRKGYWLLVLSVLAVLGILLMPIELQQRIGLVETTENVGNSTDRRTTYLLFSWEVIQESPILGIGLDGFSPAYAQSEYQYIGSDSDGRIAHNTYLEFLVGTGVLGFLIFTGLIAVSLNTTWIIGRDYQRDFIRLLGKGLFAGILGYFTVAFFLSQQYEKTLWLLFAFVVLAQRFYKKAPKVPTVT